MPRTTATLVQALLGADYGPLPDGTLPDLNQYIAGATLFINRVVTCSQRKGITLTSDESEYIERCVSAHYYQSSDPAYKQKSTSSASGGFFGQDGKGMEGTRYGQLALFADTSGCLNALAKRQTAGAFWGGSDPAPTPPVGGCW